MVLRRGIVSQHGLAYSSEESAHVQVSDPSVDISIPSRDSPMGASNTSVSLRLLTHPPMNANAISSVTQPIFRRHPLKNALMMPHLHRLQGVQGFSLGLNDGTW